MKKVWIFLIFNCFIAFSAISTNTIIDIFQTENLDENLDDMTNAGKIFSNDSEVSI